MTTKPYISGSNYVKKQGLQLSEQDAKHWDALFWSFIADHAAFFEANPRMKPMVSTWNRFSREKQIEIRSHLRKDYV